MASTILQAVLIIGLLLVWSPGFGLERETHETVNEQAARVSGVDSVLIDSLGEPEGLEKKINGISLYGWLREGGKREDDGAYWQYTSGTARPFRHFHDPLRPWGEGGLSPFVPFAVRWESAVRWVQQTTQNAQTGLGDYSWANARQYFRQALTAEAPADREQAFAQTFRALGQVTHALTDMAVPEHVRDDKHPLDGPFGYEGWVLAQHRGGATPGDLAPYLQGAAPIDPTLFTLPPPQGEEIAVTPIARLFDSDRYVGDNPAVTAESQIGLAEVANANFFSPDTVTRPYLQPSRAALQAYAAVYDKTGTKRIYYRKPSPGLDVAPALVECVLDEVANTRNVCADDAVWRATAQHLLPRAVGYSAALLDYFFRGKLEVRREGNTLRVVNRSPENLGEGGELFIYQENQEGGRMLVPGGSKTLSDPIPKDNDDAPIYLDLPTPVPTGPLMVVYTGPLGLEKNAMIGKVVPQVKVEHVYLDWDLNGWVLRTTDGLYHLPLQELAGLTAPPEKLTWGERDNQLVGVTSPIGPDPFQALLFEINRPLKDGRVPRTDTPGLGGLPQVDLRLAKRHVLTPTFDGIDVGVTVDYKAEVSLTQPTLSAKTVYNCVFSEDPQSFGYICSYGTDVAIQGSASLGTHTIALSFPLTLTRAHQRPLEWYPPKFLWELQRVYADQDGRLVAQVRFETTRSPDEQAFIQVPSYQCGQDGELVREGYTVQIGKYYLSPFAYVLALIDLDAARVLGVTSDSRIFIETVDRFAMEMEYSRCGKVEWHYSGGYFDGVVALSPQAGATFSPPLEQLVPRIIRFSLRSGEEGDVLRWEGVFRSDLRAIGLGSRPATVTGPPETSTSVVFEGVDVIVEAVYTSDYWSNPPPLMDEIGWAKWSGPSPGRLGFLAAAYDVGVQRFQSTLVGWEPAGGATRIVQGDERDPWKSVSANARGVLLKGVDAEGWDRVWWSEWSGNTIAFPGLSGPEGYVALEPDYLYNVSDGRFHTLQPALPAESEPPLLVPGLTPYGEYHVVGR